MERHHIQTLGQAASKKSKIMHFNASFPQGLARQKTSRASGSGMDRRAGARTPSLPGGPERDQEEPDCCEGDPERGQGTAVNGVPVLSLEGLEAALGAATDRALKKYREGVEKILEESLTAFETRLGQTVQQIERRDPP